MDDGKRRQVAQVIDDQVVRARRALLDALEALGAHRDSIVLVGAQAIYVRTGSAEVSLAEFTTDGDLVVDSRRLGSDPLIEVAMEAGGFTHDSATRDPGVWISRDGVHVDLMVPAAIAGKGRRGVDAPPHNRHAMRKSAGLEATLVSNSEFEIEAFDPSDARRFQILVAGPAALLVAKLYKLYERIDEQRAVENKDAHDIYRLLVAIDTNVLVVELRRLLNDTVSAEVTANALEYLTELFSAGPDAPGSVMAGAAETGIGDPAFVAQSVSLLAADLSASLAPIPE
ncbi:MAG: GSU2403 family nucleotidyltransferase fold protein [Terrimesophilobacter sp.]